MIMDVIAGTFIDSDSMVKLEDFVINNHMYSCWNEEGILLCY